MKKYIELNNNESATHLKIEVYYNLGGYNNFTSRQEPRGYYLSVSPVSRENRGGCVLESYVAFSGAKQLLKTVSRRSAKAEAEAEADAAGYLPAMIDYVCDKNNLPLPEGVTV